MSKARKDKRKPYRIVGAYDSETANITGNKIYAYPVCHQLGLLDCPIEDISPDNVKSHCTVEIYRHAVDLYSAFDAIADRADGYVPVILCHNLAFDMYGLAPYLSARDCRVLAKSQRKPITFTVLDDAGKPALVIWDTLVFSGQSLARMGDDAGYAKAKGRWDYDKVRTPYTPLTDDEIVYANDDIYSLLVWVSWWLGRNPEIEPGKLGLNVVTKTGVVRERRKLRFANLKNGKYNVGRQWYFINRQQAPKSDDELFTMQAATRGGFTFCASAFASVPFDFTGTGKVIAAFDATSQHPAQMVSHRVPVGFRETTVEVLGLAFDTISRVNLNQILRKWSKPFIRGMYASFTFTNLRPKAGTLFSRWGILPLASARFKDNANVELDEDNGDALAQDDKRRERGYADTAKYPVFAFGKLISADECTVYVTELTVWEISQCYEWDEVKPEHGYITGRFVRPSDMAVISVMQFYQAKNEYKARRGEYLANGKIENGDALRALGVADAVVTDMENCTLSINDLEVTYLSLKADLNALFGIEASNEYRRDTVLGANGIEYTGDIGICNAPKNPKAWYQFGQRIVGWSRIAQICVMQLLEPYIDGIVNGDTDSIKVICDESKMPQIQRALGRLAHAIDTGKADNTYRVKTVYKDVYDPLDGIGHYVHEYTVKRFCAAWNKAYCECDEKGFSFTLAGVPTRDVQGKDESGKLKVYETRVNGIANRMLSQGATFGEVCDKLLGYNVTYAPDVTGLNARKFPEWGDLVNTRVTDYLGNTYKVIEPCALALYPMPKTIGSTTTKDNRANLKYAVLNRPSVNTSGIIITRNGITRIGVN